MRQRITRQYGPTFREDALALLRRSGRTLAEVARDLGIPKPTLHNWYKADMAKKGKKERRAEPVDPSESTIEKLARLERENATLRKKVDELEMDRAILKKAAAFFAKENE
jgi:transposase